MPSPPRLADLQRIHIVGIGGAGMSALASLLMGNGKVVSGSDLKSSSVLERLRLLGAKVSVGHSAANVGETDAVVYSTAIPQGNVELQAARERGILTLSRADLLVAVAEGRRVAAISGTHGKTTTTSMLALSLANAGLSPSYLIGAELNDSGASGHAGASDLLVVEADESDGTFLRLDPEIAVVTNVEADHLDYYGSFDALQGAFRRFIGSSRLFPVVCVDDLVIAGFGLARESCYSYGFSDSARLQVKNLVVAPHSSVFELFLDRKRLGDLELSVLGVHNVLNATAAVGVALQLGASFGDISEALSRYVGVSRRFQHRRVVGGVRIVDDYAHLPSEIRATIAAARQLGARRIVAVFQPHRYSRTRDLWRELGEALVGADVVVVTDVYPAGEEPVPGITGELVVQAARELRSGETYYCPRRGELAGVVASHLREDDICLSMGAGDITTLEAELGEVLG